ncbi:MAG: CBS domain-containing protein [Methanoregulaceae archaeon]|nr:CBS domain-containing protein [Methanoregulaceae archaeon]
MHQHDKGMKQGDKLLKMPGKMDRGPVEFKSRIAEREGEIMAIATSQVISVPPTMSILGAVETMTSWGFRRLPIVDPGTRKLRGIVTSGDIINLLGGGDKSNLVRVKHAGNLLPAINEPIRGIMTQQVRSIPHSAEIAEAINIIITQKIGGIPIIDEEGVMIGIVTERDVLRMLANERSSLTVEDVMSTSLRVTSPDSSLGSVTKDMTKYRFRRLPVVIDDVVYGIVTTTDIMAYLGTGEVFSQLVTGNISEFMALPVRQIVSGNFYTTTPDRNITEVAREMLDRNAGALPVMESARLIGLVTEFDLVKALARGSA